MNIDKMNRKEIINELQKLAESVLELKAERRQKHPIVIEFSGSPKAGKTSCINSLELFLKRNGFSVKIIQERASVCPVSDKQSPMFNFWTACMSLAGLIGTLKDNKSQVDVLILDRGIFDALCWFQWLVSAGKMEKDQKYIAEQFLLMDDLVRCIDIVFAFCADPDISIEREYANLLTDKLGTIMNKKVLSAYLEAIEDTINNKKEHFHSIYKIDTSEKNQDEVGKEVTSITLNNLKNLLMERIGFFERTEEMEKVLLSKSILQYDDLNGLLPLMEFDLRDDVEMNTKLLQPIPIAIITNKDKNKVLVIRKNRNAVSENSPEKNKNLLYIGGHSRYEDQTEITSKDFLSICRITLKREVEEEIGIRIALNDIIPFFIYSTNDEISKKHMAVCFLVSVDEENLILHLDQQELVQKKGRSKSGRFLGLDELKNEKLEDWSRTILKYVFNINSSNQLTLFDVNENL